MARECPNCRLVNPPDAQRCDCGYDFALRRVEPSYLTARDRADVESRSNWRFVGLLVVLLSSCVGAAIGVCIDLRSGGHDGDPHGYSFLFTTPFSAAAGAIAGGFAGLVGFVIAWFVRDRNRPTG